MFYIVSNSHHPFSFQEVIFSVSVLVYMHYGLLPCDLLDIASGCLRKANPGHPT